MNCDRSFEELFQSLGISIAISTLGIAGMKCITVYYFSTLMFILCVIVAILIAYQQYNHTIVKRTKPLDDEEAILSKIFDPIQKRHQDDVVRQRSHTFTNFDPTTPMRKISRVLKRPLSAHLEFHDEWKC